jgi:glyoxylase-like metal-dependent hydrolase (beta-lactamase superfamily II)
MRFHSTEIPRIRQTTAGVLLLLSMLIPAAAQETQGVRTGTLPVAWDSGGPKCMEMPEWQTHEYNPDLYIMRQSGCTDFEKPFVFLLFGGERALLLDTGSRNGNIAPQIALIVHRWLTRNGRDSIPLLVVHTHGHGDHIAGDAALQALNDAHIPITLIPATVEENQKIFRIAHWPEDVGAVDLGNRIIDALAIPGHQDAGIALYDRQTGILFTGDSVYPGRLYIHDLATFQKSNERMLRFTAGKPLTHIIGNHIEQTRTPYLDYPEGTLWQPQEHELALSRGVLLEIQAGLESMHGKPQRIAYRDFTLWPRGPRSPEDEARVEAYKQQQRKNMWQAATP